MSTAGFGFAIWMGSVRSLSIRPRFIAIPWPILFSTAFVRSSWSKRGWSRFLKSVSLLGFMIELFPVTGPASENTDSLVWCPVRQAGNRSQMPRSPLVSPNVISEGKAPTTSQKSLASVLPPFSAFSGTKAFHFVRRTVYNASVDQFRRVTRRPAGLPSQGPGIGT